MKSLLMVLAGLGFSASLAMASNNPPNSCTPLPTIENVACECMYNGSSGSVVHGYLRVLLSNGTLNDSLLSTFTCHDPKACDALMECEQYIKFNKLCQR